MEKYFNNKCIFLDSGYPAIYMPESHLAKNNGTVRIHLLVMEEILERKLLANEVVHHIDKNRMNYSKDNLMCFATNSDHIAFHHGDTAIVTQNGSYVCINKKEKGSGKCSICGKKIYKYSTNCKSCASKIRETGNSKIPTYNVLKSELLYLNYSQIGKKYGVTDNTIRKWCNKLKLPTKHAELLQFRNDNL